MADALGRCADLLTHYGGHRSAGGFSLAPDRIGAFRERLLALAAATGSRTIAYTYTEPVVYYEYMFDTAKLARSKGIERAVSRAARSRSCSARTNRSSPLASPELSHSRSASITARFCVPGMPKTWSTPSRSSACSVCCSASRC